MVLSVIWVDFVMFFKRDLDIYMGILGIRDGRIVLHDLKIEFYCLNHHVTCCLISLNICCIMLRIYEYDNLKYLLIFIYLSVYPCCSLSRENLRRVQSFWRFRMKNIERLANLALAGMISYVSITSCAFRMVQIVFFMFYLQIEAMNSWEFDSTLFSLISSVFVRSCNGVEKLD